MKKQLSLIFFMILLASFASGQVLYNQSFPNTYGNGNENALDDRVWAEEFFTHDTINHNLSGVYGSVGGSTDATRVCIYNATSKLGMVCTSYSASGYANFTSLGFKLYPRVKYVIGWDRSGATWNGIYNASAVFHPASVSETNKFLNFTTGVYFEPPSNTTWTNYTGWLMLYKIVLVNESGTPEADVTPPSISTAQTPTNWTVHTVMTQNNYVVATITDATGVDNSSIYMNFTKINSSVYVNGTLTQDSRDKNYTNASGAYYQFNMDEQDLLGGSFNLDHDYMEANAHTGQNLTSLNSWLKVQFLNISNKVSYNLYEVMAENATATSCMAEYWYCNDQYTTGNPISDPACVLFSSENNNRPRNHTHTGGNSWHKYISLGINNGMIGDVNVTRTSYILKRGTTCTDTFYYVPLVSRVGAAQTSTNLGNTWSNFAGTPDMHIHQVSNSSSILYNVCANDTLTPENKGCSTIVTEIIDTFPIAPNAVLFHDPIGSREYNTTLRINHTESASASGFTIENYMYEYRISNTSTWVWIANNTHPTTYYDWDISSFLNRYYQVRATARDSNGLSSVTYSDDFYIRNPLSTTDQLLTELLAEVQASREETSMIYTIGIIILPILIAFLLLYAANTLSEDHNLIKMFLFGMAMIMPIISLQYAMEITTNTSALTALLNSLGLHSTIFAWVYVVLIIYFVLMAGIGLFKYIAEKKKEDLKY